MMQPPADGLDATTPQARGVRGYVIEEYTTTVCPVCASAGALNAADPRTWCDGMLVRHSGSIWLHRFCPEHGESESLYEEDAALWEARRGWAAPTQHVVPDRGWNFSGAPNAYCGGLPASHGQHTCTLLLNVSDSCSFACPTCYSASVPERGGNRRTPSISEVLHTVEAVLDREGGKLGVLMLSGGEPTERSDLEQLIKALLPLPITRIMLNTNGRRLAANPHFAEFLGTCRDRVEVYLQFDGLTAASYLALRGANVLQEKLKAIANLTAARVFTTLVPTVARNINEHELGDILRFALDTPYCAGLALQPLFGSGRVSPFDPRDRATPTGVIKRLAQQSKGLLAPEDFIPLPCPGRDCCDITYLVQTARGKWRTITRLAGRDLLKQWTGLISNTMTFEHLSQPVRDLLASGSMKRLFSEQLGAGAPELAQDIMRLCACAPRLAGTLFYLARKTRPRRAKGAACACEADRIDELSRRTFRITVKMFMDAHTLHLARLRQCCVHTGTFEDDPRRYPFCWRWLFSDASDFPQGG